MGATVNKYGLLAGKVAVVTGASRGIGEAIAIRYAQEGARVVVSARTVEEGDHMLPGSIRGVAERIRKAGGEAAAVRCDLSVAQDRANLVAETERLYGPVDILVNNGAVTWFLPVEEFPEKRFKLMMEVQVYAPFHLSQLVLPRMKQRRSGWILNVSSHAAIHPALDSGGRGGTVYGMCKAALERFTTGLAAEVREHGIGVNVISPGLIATPGAVFFKLVNESTEHLAVPVENMAEACLRLVHGDPAKLSGRVTYAADILGEFRLEPAELMA
jgi:NAD(P)-dependent dehydrogenase (short-subunit alcohol dehydrogenase family)